VLTLKACRGRKRISSVNKHTEMLVAEATELPSIGSAMAGHDAVGPMRSVVSAATGEASVQSALHAAPETAQRDRGQGGV
jgi:hypothetical protein